MIANHEGTITVRHRVSFRDIRAGIAEIRLKVGAPPEKCRIYPSGGIGALAFGAASSWDEKRTRSSYSTALHDHVRWRLPVSAWFGQGRQRFRRTDLGIVGTGSLTQMRRVSPGPANYTVAYTYGADPAKPTKIVATGTSATTASTLLNGVETQATITGSGAGTYTLTTSGTVTMCGG